MEEETDFLMDNGWIGLIFKYSYLTNNLILIRKIPTIAY